MGFGGVSHLQRKGAHHKAFLSFLHLGLVCISNMLHKYGEKNQHLINDIQPIVTKTKWGSVKQARSKRTSLTRDLENKYCRHSLRVQLALDAWCHRKSTQDGGMNRNNCHK